MVTANIQRQQPRHVDELNNKNDERMPVLSQYGCIVRDRHVKRRTILPLLQHCIYRLRIKEINEMMGSLIRLGCFEWQAPKTGQNRSKTGPKPLAGVQNRQNRMNS